MFCLFNFYKLYDSKIKVYEKQKNTYENLKKENKINKYDILKFISNSYIIKIKDQTKIAYDLEKLENENTRQITNQVEIQNDKSDDLDVNYA